MRRHWNWALWVGFFFILIAAFSYEYLARFPITRDFPWANLLLFGVGGTLLVVGLARAFGKPVLYRGKIFGSIFLVLSVLLFGVFSYALFYLVRQMPASAGAPRVGEKAPQFTLPDQNGKPVALADLLSSPNGKAGGALLIFYRGFW